VRAASSRAAYRASRAAASIPPAVPTCTVRTSTGSRPSARHCSPARRATSAEPSWSPWSTTTAPAPSPARGSANAAAAASTSESGPPEHATSTSEPPGRSSTLRRTARRAAATSGCGPATSAQDPANPGPRVGDLTRGGQRVGTGEHGVDRVAARLLLDSSHERRALAVLRELRVEAEQAPQDPLEGRADRAAPRVEARPDRGDRGHDPWADGVHRDVRVPLEERHDGTDLLDDLGLLAPEHPRERGTRVERRPAVAQRVAQHSRDPFDEVREALGDAVLALTLRELEEAFGPGAQVVGEPRGRGELQRVGLLVQRDPEAEVG